MKNLYLLPTEQPSRLVKIKDTFFLTSTDDIPGGTFYNIYITNDEDLILGGFHFNSKYGDEPQKTDQRDIDSRKYWEEEYYYISKIILTTDPTLIADGVQTIDNEFLKWFVKNSNCEFVVIDWSPLSKNLYGWKIIIPQEEPKPESLVEAAEKWVFETNSHKWSNNDNTAGDNFGSFIAGAKSDAARDYWFQQFKKL